MPQDDFEISWHGSKWRDDYAPTPTPETVTTPQGLSPWKRPHEKRGGRKPVIAAAVAQTLRTAEKPLSAVEVYVRIHKKQKCTVAGVNSAIGRLRTDGKIVRAERRAGFGQFGCTYQWTATPAREALEAVQFKARKAEIGRLGGVASAEARRKATSC